MKKNILYIFAILLLFSNCAVVIPSMNYPCTTVEKIFNIHQGMY